MKLLNTKLTSELGLAILITLFVSPVALAFQATQETDKSLSIERYSDEPLDLVELKIGSQSLKDRIATTFRRENGAGVDTVSFRERQGWFRQLEIRLRNVTSKPIYGVSARLFFRPPDRHALFSLPLTGFTQLGQGVLEPNGEITLMVTEHAWNLTAEIFKRHDLNPDLVPVSFGLDIIQFDDLQWSKGQMLRRDPDNPNRWIPSNKVVPRKQ